MKPIPVSDQQLQQGIDDVTQWLPNPSLPSEHWAELAAEALFYDAMAPNAQWELRTVIDTEEARRHLYAIRASTKLTPADKLKYMSKLITLWFSGVRVPNE